MRDGADQAVSITEKEFLILTIKAGNEFRRITGWSDVSMERMRAKILGAISGNGRVIRERKVRTGIERIYRVRIHADISPLNLAMVWGIARNGQRQTSPDGKRWNVYLVGVSEVAGQEIAEAKP